MTGLPEEGKLESGPSCLKAGGCTGGSLVYTPRARGGYSVPGTQIGGSWRWWERPLPFSKRNWGFHPSVVGVAVDRWVGL